MNFYPLLTLTRAGECVKYSLIIKGMVNVCVERSENNESCSMLFELTHDNINLIKVTGFSETETNKWEQKIYNLKNIIFELAGGSFK